MGNPWEDGLPTISCPVTLSEIILRADVLALGDRAEIACPSCGQRHTWDRRNRLMLALPIASPEMPILHA